MTYYHSKYGRPKKRKRGFARFILWVLLLLVMASMGVGYHLYTVIQSPNVWTADGKAVSILIPSEASFDDVKQILFGNGLIIKRDNFTWWAEQKGYPKLIKPGKYMIEPGMNNNDLVTLLRAGNQVPVKVTFNNIRSVYDLASKVASQIEADSASLVLLLTDSVYISKMGLNRATIGSIFIPNTYEFYWTTTAESFIDRMYAEFLSFWKKRSSKLESLGYTREEVITLASIVEKETAQNDEKASIAGVYINRLKKGWLLQADPTLIFAMGDYNITRVLNAHKNIDSPYNTYKYAGLPPGPICIPSIASIEAVLNYEEHDFLYFCARDDLSGYHVFAKTNMQHSRNARKYQKALDELRIYK